MDILSITKEGVEIDVDIIVHMHTKQKLRLSKHNWCDASETGWWCGQTRKQRIPGK